MPAKIYVLLPALDVDAPIYQTTGQGTRSQITKIPRHRPYLDIQVEHKTSGKSRRLRYKSICETPFADGDDGQIKKYGIDANAKFTDIERDESWFRHGILATTKENLQRFLEAHPEFEGSEYKSEHVRQVCYKLLDLAAETKVKNQDLKRRVKAANKIMDLKSIEEAQALMFRINGSFFEAPKDLEECQNQLIEWLDQAEDKGIDDLMKDAESITVDEHATILLGELLTAGLLSFDAKENEISKKDKDGKWVAVRNLSSTEYTREQREGLFSDFLNTEDGKPLKDDLESDLAEYKKKNKTKSPPKT